MIVGVVIKLRLQSIVVSGECKLQLDHFFVVQYVFDSWNRNDLWTRAVSSFTGLYNPYNSSNDPKNQKLDGEVVPLLQFRISSTNYSRLILLSALLRNRVVLERRSSGIFKYKDRTLNLSITLRPFSIQIIGLVEGWF